MIVTMYNMETHPERHLRGMIVGVLDVPTDDVPLCLDEYVSVVISEGDFETEYCDGTGFLPRQAVTASFNLTEATTGSTVTLSGLPDPCMLYVNAELLEVIGGSYDLLLANTGDYLVELFESKYERKVWLVIAT